MGKGGKGGKVGRRKEGVKKGVSSERREWRLGGREGLEEGVVAIRKSFQEK